MSEHQHADQVLSVRDLTKSFRVSGGKTLRALDGINLDLARGETLGLVGESGCGKSTLARTLMMLERPDSGSVTFDGIDPFGLKGKDLLKFRRRVQMVFQDPYASLNSRMTAAENVEYPLFLADVPLKERQQRVMAMLRAVGLEEHAQHRPDALSGGQRQRVAIARALVKRPAVVIADEPTASLDTDTAEQVLALMRELGRAQGAAFLIATHDDRLVRRCDRVLHLRDGLIDTPNAITEGALQ